MYTFNWIDVYGKTHGQDVTQAIEVIGESPQSLIQRLAFAHNAVRAQICREEPYEILAECWGDTRGVPRVSF